MGKQNLSILFKLISNKAESKKKTSEGILIVNRLMFSFIHMFYFQAHFAKSRNKLYVSIHMILAYIFKPGKTNCFIVFF